MCGRTRVSMAPDQVAAAVGVSEGAQWEGRERYRASYNVSPGHDTPVVRLSTDGSKQLHTMRWGLVPSFTKPTEQRNDHYRMMNARSETMAEKGVFKRLLERRRCLVPVNGFYEWRQEAGKKQPYHVHLGEGNVMMLAGLYDCWRRGDGGAKELRQGGSGRGETTPGQPQLKEEEEEEEDGLYTYTILTTDSSKPIRWLHDRMPVILRTPEAQEQWLRGDLAAAAAAAAAGDRRRQGPRIVLSAVCSPYQGEDLAAYPVTPAMSKATYQGSDACKKLKRNTVMGMFARAAGTPTTKEQGTSPHSPGPSPGKPHEEEEEEEEERRQKHSDQAADGVPSSSSAVAATESSAAEAPRQEGHAMQGEQRQQKQQDREQTIEEARDERKRRNLCDADEEAEAARDHREEGEGVTTPSGDGDARYAGASRLGAPGSSGAARKRPRTTILGGSGAAGNNKGTAGVSPGDKKKQSSISSFFSRK